MKRIFFYTFMALLSYTYNVDINAQEKKSKKELKLEEEVKIKQLITSQNYEFIAQRAQPMSGRAIDLTSSYDLYIGKDTIAAYLPYFGRAYTASYGGDGGIKFNSNNFTYSLLEAKKGGWIINLSVKDNTKIYRLTLNISKSGKGTLTVTDTDRQSITFSGYINEKK